MDFLLVSRLFFVFKIWIFIRVIFFSCSIGEKNLWSFLWLIYDCILIILIKFDMIWTRDCRSSLLLDHWGTSPTLTLCHTHMTGFMFRPISLKHKTLSLFWYIIVCLCLNRNTYGKCRVTILLRRFMWEFFHAGWFWRCCKGKNEI